MIPEELIEKYPDYTLQQHISAGHLDAFTQSNIPTTEMFEFAKQVIELSDSYRIYWSRKVCAICDKKLTESDYATMPILIFCSLVMNIKSAETCFKLN